MEKLLFEVKYDYNLARSYTAISMFLGSENSLPHHPWHHVPHTCGNRVFFYIWIHEPRREERRSKRVILLAPPPLWFAFAVPLSAHIETASLLMHACKWPCQYDPLSLSPFKVAWQRTRPPLAPLPFLDQPTSDSHAISCMCSGACVRVCMICRKMAGTGFVQMLAPPFGLEAKVFRVVSERGESESNTTLFHTKKECGIVLARPFECVHTQDVILWHRRGKDRK